MLHLNSTHFATGRVITLQADAAGLVTYMVMDAGKTQIASGSRTVLGIGPAPETAVLGITDRLKLM